MSMSSPSPSPYQAIVEATELLDEDESPVESKEILGEISKDRLQVWVSRLGNDLDLNDLDNAAHTYIAVRCEGSRGLLEHAVCVRKNESSEQGIDTAACSSSPILTECMVSCEELPPSALVEYQFDCVHDGDVESSQQQQEQQHQPWFLSMVSLEYLLAFRAGKFKDWEKRMLQPSCQAEFRRMFQVGPVFSVYDHPMFPSPPEEMEHFTVKDEKTGRKLILPRPVAALRIWSTEKQAYEDVDPTLDGAPITKEDRDLYWKDLIVKLNVHFGQEEFEKMIAKPS